MKNFKVTTILFLLFSTIAFSQGSILENIIAQINLDSLKLYVRQLSGDTACTIGGAPYTIVSRHKNQPGNNKAAEYIYQKFQSFGIQAAYETFSTTGSNVIGTKTGTLYPNRYYVVCAHFDDMPTGTTAPGADDNASGTAAVIEIARVFSQYNFPYTVKFIAFDEEEQGLVGSAYYATQARNRNDSIMGVLNLDMIAYDGNNDHKINVHNKNVANTPEIVQDIVNNNLSYNIGLQILVVASQPYSDHDSFHQKNYGATLIIEDDADFHPQYHTVNDKVNYYNWPYYHKNVRLTAVTLAKYALNFKIVLEHNPIITSNSTSQREAVLVVNSGLTIGVGTGAPRLFYRYTQNSVTSPWYSLTDPDGPDGNQYNFFIPGFPLGTKVEYYFGVQDVTGSLVQTLPAGGSGFNPPGSTPPSTFYSYLVANAVVVLNDPADNLDHWISQSLWTKVTTSFFSPPSSFKDNPNSTYPNSTTNIFLLKDTITIPANVLGATLTFRTKFDLESKYDYVQLQYSTNNGSTWTAMAGKYTIMSTGTFQPPNEPVYNGTQSAWVKEEINLSSFAGKSLRFRFYFKSDASVVKEGMYVDDFNISYFSAQSSQVTTSFNTNEGWNLTSVPLILNDMSKSAIFPQAASNAYGYNENYFVCDTLKLGCGYWVKFNSQFTHNFTGNPAGSFNIPLSAGWNLIGALDFNKPVSTITTTPAGIISSAFYEYNSSYMQATELEKGKGYWVKASQNGVLHYTTSSSKVHNFTNDLNKFSDRLIITDAKDRSTTLYLSKENINLNLYELPPTPPAEAFDVRFASNTNVTKINDISQILINSAAFPLRIEFLSKDNTNLVISGNNESYSMQSGTMITLLNKSNSLSLKSDYVPTDFALYQNYPNPFNPNTTIKYSLPSETNVQLIIFNGLGQEIKTLINEIQKPGIYNINFEAKDLSSGIYYYELRAGNYREIKKMMLMK